MPVSMYTVSIPVFIQHLNGLNTVLEKAGAWAANARQSFSQVNGECQAPHALLLGVLHRNMNTIMLPSNSTSTR